MASGTDALFLALSAIGAKDGEVLTVPNSFISTSLAISYAGARPVFVDIDPLTYTVNTQMIENKITPKTKAIFPVHIYGHPADMDPIMEIAEEYNLKVVEDACQAHGAEYKGKKVGSIGHVGCFSFYPTKNLGCYGDGGMIITKDPKIAQKLRLLRNYGEARKYFYSTKGYNSRLDEVQAAVLRVKLKKLDRWNALRRKNAKLYNKLLEGRVSTPTEEKHTKHVYYAYVIRCKKREKLRQWLKTRNIGTSIHYPVPIHLQDSYSELEHKKGDFPVTEKYSDEILSLPIFPELSKAEIKIVVKEIYNFYLSE